MTEGDELGHTEKVWVLRAALDRDAVDAHQWGCAPVGMRTRGDAHQGGCATGPRLGRRAVDSTASAAFSGGRPEHWPRAAL
jgi:hypothetical protein